MSYWGSQLQNEVSGQQTNDLVVAHRLPLGGRDEISAHRPER